jgi:hypothetical protein
MNKNLPLSTCQSIIANTWFIGFIVVCSLFFFQYINHVYAGIEQNACSWFFPSIIPSFSIVLGAVFRDMNKPPSQATANQSAIVFAVGSSIMYLMFLLTVLIRLISIRIEHRLDFIQQMSPFLAAIQGIAGAGLGAFMVSTDAKHSHALKTPKTQS